MQAKMIPQLKKELWAMKSKEQFKMNPTHDDGRSLWLRRRFGVALSMAALSVTTEVHAICNLDGAAMEQIRSVENPEASRALNLRLSRRGAAGYFSGGSCIACHSTGIGGPRNTFGNAVNTILTRRDRDDAARQRDAGRRMTDILANP